VEQSLAGLDLHGIADPPVVEVVDETDRVHGHRPIAETAATSAASHDARTELSTLPYFVRRGRRVRNRCACCEFDSSMEALAFNYRCRFSSWGSLRHRHSRNKPSRSQSLYLRRPNGEISKTMADVTILTSWETVRSGEDWRIR
jgi:hypothetical protein